MDDPTKEIDHVLNSWGYTMNAVDYMSAQNNLRQSSVVVGRGRGRGCVDVSADGLERIRMAARINRLQADQLPMGHLPTTEETLAQDVGPEITASLRSFGISGVESQLSRKTTRPTVLDTRDDVHIDGTVPVILNGDVFHPRYTSVEDEVHGDRTPQPDLPFDPAKPLQEQFETIDEFKPPPSPRSNTNRDKPSALANPPKPSKNKPAVKKKQKWKKMSLEAATPTRGRYDTDLDVGHPPVNPNGAFTRRVVHGANGPKKL